MQVAIDAGFIQHLLRCAPSVDNFALEMFGDQ